MIEEIELVISGDWIYSTTSLEWSNRVRLVSSYETLKLVPFRPLLGLGFGAVTSHGSTTMLLCGVGLVGTFLWIYFSCFSCRSLIIQTDKFYYKLCILIWIVGNLLNSLGLRPFYEMTTFCIMIALSIIFISRNQSNNQSSKNILINNKLR